jgi:tetratricopeptide (TPR) repeat protein
VIPECPYRFLILIPPSKPHEPAWAPDRETSQRHKGMPLKISHKFGVILSALTMCAVLSQAQTPPASPIPRQRVRTTTVAPTTASSIDVSETMFATMCALYAAGYEGDVSADSFSTYRAQMRDRLRQQKGPAVDALREFYRAHRFRDPGAMLSRFVWFGLVAGPAPKFQPTMRRDELPPEVLDLEGFSDILAHYYAEQNIRSLWLGVQPLYEREIERLHDTVSQIVFVAGNYTRIVVDPAKFHTFSVIVEPLVGRITNVRNFGDRYAIILSGSEEIPIDVVRHAYLHFLLDTLPLQYSHVVIVKRAAYEVAAKAPRLPDDLKEDFFSWFGECTVRAVEIKLKKLSPSEREAALQANDADGYTMVRPIFLGLTDYEKGEPNLMDYFPDLVRAIDVKAEIARASKIAFASGQTDDQSKELTRESSARRRAKTTATLPDDDVAIAALTEGEKRLAEKNPRAAETAFQSVLAKYPDQPRAWYGIGMVAVLDHDADKAKEVFGRLTTGEHAASQDPLVMAWSHIYLARILEDQGQLDQAKTEYQAVLNLQDAPPQAQQAAQKGLGDLALRK